MTTYKLGRIAFNSKEKRMPEASDQATYIGLEHLETDRIDVTRYGSKVPLKGTKLVAKKGDVLFGRRNAYLKRSAVAPFDCLFSAHGLVLRPNTDVIDPEFFPFFMSSEPVFEEAIRISVGSLSPTVNWSAFSECVFDLPSREKQHELAKIMKEAALLKTRYANLINTCDDLVKSQFIEMFGSPFETKDNFVALGECCKITTGNTPSRKHPEYYGSDVEWIKSDNILPGAASLEKAKECLSEAGAEVGRIALPGWLLMVCIAGSPNTIGNVARVDRRVAFNQQINGIDPCEQNPIYIQAVLGIMKSKLCEGLNSALKCILNKSTLSAIRIPLPPIDQQIEFAEFVTQVDKSKFALQKALDDLNAMTKKLIGQELGLGNV